MLSRICKGVGARGRGAGFALIVGCFGFLGCGDDTPPAEPELCGDQPCGEGAYCDSTSRECFCEPGGLGDPREECVPHGDLCGEAAARVGHGVCREQIVDRATWSATSIPFAARGDVKRLAKYLLHAEPDAPIAALFTDTNFYRLHYCMLKEAFEPLFPGYRYADYNWDVYFRERRRMFAGSIYELNGANLAAPYAFLIETPDDPDELLTEPEVYRVYRQLQDRFGVGELAYLPYTAAQEERAASWVDPRFEIVVTGDEVISFEPYSAGATYGRVRLYGLDEVESASGTFGAQDILVLETSTNTLEGVNAGVITGVRQDLLSHLNVLAAQRGTPNAFVADPLEAFAPFEGELVRLDVTENTYTIAPATVTEAESFWAANRPMASIDRPPDADFTDLVGLLEVPTDTAEERAVSVSRIGGKASGLAGLYKDLDPSYQVAGFAIPVVYYLDFMERNIWPVDVAGQTQMLSYADTITLWLADEVFRTDTGVRRARLDALSEHMRTSGSVDPELLWSLEGKVIDVFGDTNVMMRFRSSSNAEDGVAFNGAGLYDSTRACAADSTDGPTSVCDPESESRSMQRGLQRVWASVWGFGAYEERQYFQIDQSRVAMGVLVTARFKGEQANGVVFTGNPLDPNDHRITVNVQLGEVDVVGTTPGVVAELDRLTIRGGAVVDVERVSASSLVAEGEVVLRDSQLYELGSIVAAIESVHPATAGGDSNGVLLDLEFKIDADGRLLFKQVRPFLPSAVDPNYATCELN